MKNKLLNMLEIQDQLNSRLDPNWRERDWNFRLAAKMEAAEAIDHIGYKWWQNQEPNMAQARMECVDIMHFVLSDLLNTSHTQESLQSEAEFFTSRYHNWHQRIQPDHPHDALQRVMQEPCLPTVLYVMFSLDYSFDDLYRDYIGKAALNQFRWEHDYSGSYQKMWQGREDNEHLTELLATLQPDEVSLERVKALLAERYQSCIA